MIHTSSLYKLSVRKVVQCWSMHSHSYPLLPTHTQIDIVEMCISSHSSKPLISILNDIQVFSNLLTEAKNLTTLYRAMQTLVNHKILLPKRFSAQYEHSFPLSHTASIALARFFLESGWFDASEKILSRTARALEGERSAESLQMLFTTHTHLLSAYISNCLFEKAQTTFNEAMSVVKKLSALGLRPNCALLYAEEAYRYFCLSNFSKANQWVHRALEEVNEDLNTQQCIQVLRKCTKVYVVTRYFTHAEVLIKHAVFLSQLYYGTHHPLYAESLLDYGFYLLHVDQIAQCVKVYQNATHITDVIFGNNNIKTAIAHEDLSYAEYVNDYGNGSYRQALYHAEKSISIVKSILPSRHLLNASTSRVKALILEELAIDNDNYEQKKYQLKQAKILHTKSLQLSKEVFGEENIQTAKHYGNLGRLFQTMRSFKRAEKMHKRAIQIKESILGAEHYEVALSLGHLASLYNYDMEKYMEAEHLYMRSIAISHNLFGRGFSGLEYDYRGLISLYHSTNQVEKAFEYTQLLNEWQYLKELDNTQQAHELFAPIPSRSTKEVLTCVIEKL